MADAFAPLVVIEFAVQFDIGTTEANFLAIDAGEIRFTTNAGAKAGVERVIPDVEFPDVGRIAHGKKIDGRHQFSVGAGDFVCYVDDIFIGSNAIKSRHSVVRQRIVFQLESPTRMGGATNSALFFGPAERVQTE